jgi:hypothetical protein
MTPGLNFIFLVGLLAALPTTASCEAGKQGKNDILGFYPDMPFESFRERLIQLKCKDDTCQLDDGIMQFRRTTGLPQDHVKQVAYKFKSGLKPREMIGYIGKQYGVTPSKADIGDIGYAMGHYEDLPPLGTKLVTGGTICRFHISGGMTLVLYLDETPKELFSYILYLTSDKLDRAQEAAAQRAKGEAIAKKREVNREPRL